MLYTVYRKMPVRMSARKQDRTKAPYSKCCVCGMWYYTTAVLGWCVKSSVLQKCKNKSISEHAVMKPAMVLKLRINKFSESPENK